MAHHYQYDSLSRLPICADCGVCQHRNGKFWLRGKWSKTEPPCTDDENGQRQWFAEANDDPDAPFAAVSDAQ